MQTVFNRLYNGDAEDAALAAMAAAGDGTALETLIARHQVWLYNIALRMVGRSADAEDVAQEVLVKMITKLSTFEARASFRTWLYRIAANHVLNMKRRSWERWNTFARHAELIENLADTEPGNSAEDAILADAVKTSCMTGMLLCLDRRQRLALILGSIFGADSGLGAEIMAVSETNFRQMLSRARGQLKNFMSDHCGLMNPDNPCRCPKKTRAAVAKGLVDPDSLQFYNHAVRRVRDFVSNSPLRAVDVRELKMRDLFREHPLRPAPYLAGRMRRMLENKTLSRFIEFE